MTKALQSYSEEERRRGLTAVAFYNGNTRAAARALKAQGVEIPRETLRGWMRRHEETYDEVRRELIPRINERVAEGHLALADAEMELAWEFLEQLRQDKDQIPARDLSTALRNLDVGSGVHSDKALALRAGLPSNQPIPEDFNATLASLKSQGITFKVEVTNEPKQVDAEAEAVEIVQSDQDQT